MLLLAPQSYDGSRAVALRLERRQGGKREPGDQFTNGGAGGNELTEIVLIATDQRILYHRDCCDLSERYIGRLHGFRAPLVDEYERLPHVHQVEVDRKRTRLTSSHSCASRMPSSA